MEPTMPRPALTERPGDTPLTTEITWIGHSTALIRTGDTWILTDPVLRGRTAHLRRRSPLLPEDWPARVDAILISHLHLDHCDLPTLRRLGRHVPIVVPAGAGAWLRKRGFRQIEELAIGDTNWTLVVQGLNEQRRPAPEARQLYEETQESSERRAAEQETRRLAPVPGSDLRGRPTKKARRQIKGFNEF